MVADKQEGIAVPRWGVDTYDDPEFGRAVTGILGLGGEWITLVPTWYQADARASTIGPDPISTPSDGGISRAAALARQSGARIVLKPHVDVADGTWRGLIAPGDVAAWFRSYTAMITHYAQLAVDIDADLLVVGTELDGLAARTAEWLAVIQAVRAAGYRGPLTYAASWGVEGTVRFWGSLDYIGSDAYYPLSTQPTQDVAALVQAWQPIKARLAQLVARYGRPLLFTEAGYESQAGSTVTPFGVYPPGPRVDGEQAAAYEALLRVFWPEPWFAGVHWWGWDDPAVDGYDIAFAPNGKEAETVLRRWWQ